MLDLKCTVLRGTVPFAEDWLSFFLEEVHFVADEVVFLEVFVVQFIFGIIRNLFEQLELEHFPAV